MRRKSRPWLCWRLFLSLRLAILGVRVLCGMALPTAAFSAAGFPCAACAVWSTGTLLIHGDFSSEFADLYPQTLALCAGFPGARLLGPRP
ncbi:uncharacterized protein BDR25DRAFT_2908 [Lindgomyces ingoldianus]|uniref:Uncharacterized protein n=1 Tax=Lindgomyces ingoldianus TaxID=673940 RepID=A0ACB6RH69_9PLEO|nr:uncharacterized protein BDR25DRAFT_2908 [Lindgomyces ingoldianus]KAF2477667.1 hypothetical protein BDR25DRAFT_2908 [Lindgomyces ingoldianus]